MAKFKIGVEEIKEVVKDLEKEYEPLIDLFRQDEMYYERKFKELLNIQGDFAKDAVVLPTARDYVDTFVDHVNIKNARVYVNRMGETQISNDRAEMMRKFYMGIIYGTNLNSELSQWRIGAKHIAAHGLSVFKTVYDGDAWPDKPEKKTSESQKGYDARLEEWVARTHSSIPILVSAIHPGSAMKKTDYLQRTYYVVEKHEKVCFDVKKRWPNWSNPLNKRLEDKVDLVLYWDDDDRCDLVDGEPILRAKGGVARHGYGFIPYVFINSGAGNLSYENDITHRYVGILRHIYDLLRSESANYSMADILMRRETMKGGYITGVDANSDVLKNLTQEYGVYTPFEDKDIEIHDWETKIAPAEVYQHLGVTNQYISGHAAPPSVRGQSQSGVRSAAHFTQIRNEAANIYQYSEEAFKNGTQQILINCAKLQKYILPSGMKLWSHTMADSYNGTNVVIDRDMMQEPFICHVEFSPMTPEDEYRRHIDLSTMWDRGQGIISEEFAWSRMPNIDPEAMRVQKTKERIRNDPNYQAPFIQEAARRVAEAIQKAAIAETPPIPPIPMPQPGMQQGMPPPGGPSQQGHFMPGANQPVTPGSELEQAYQQARRRPVVPGIQGQGGGGNRP